MYLMLHGGCDKGALSLSIFLFFFFFFGVTAKQTSAAVTLRNESTVLSLIIYEGNCSQLCLQGEIAPSAALLSQGKVCPPGTFIYVYVEQKVPKLPRES